MRKKEQFNYFVAHKIEGISGYFQSKTLIHITIDKKYKKFLFYHLPYELVINNTERIYLEPVLSSKREVSYTATSTKEMPFEYLQKIVTYIYGLYIGAGGIKPLAIDTNNVKLGFSYGGIVGFTQLRLALPNNLEVMHKLSTTLLTYGSDITFDSLKLLEE